MQLITICSECRRSQVQGWGWEKLGAIPTFPRCTLRQCVPQSNSLCNRAPKAGLFCKPKKKKENLKWLGWVFINLLVMCSELSCALCVDSFLCRRAAAFPVALSHCPVKLQGPKIFAVPCLSSSFPTPISLYAPCLKALGVRTNRVWL